TRVDFKRLLAFQQEKYRLMPWQCITRLQVVPFLEDGLQLSAWRRFHEINLPLGIGSYLVHGQLLGILGPSDVWRIRIPQCAVVTQLDFLIALVPATDVEIVILNIGHPVAIRRGNFTYSSVIGIAPIAATSTAPSRWLGFPSRVFDFIIRQARAPHLTKSL